MARRQQPTETSGSRRGATAGSDGGDQMSVKLLPGLRVAPTVERLAVARSPTRGTERCSAPSPRVSARGSTASSADDGACGARSRTTSTWRMGSGGTCPTSLPWAADAQTAEAGDPTSFSTSSAWRFRKVGPTPWISARLSASRDGQLRCPRGFDCWRPCTRACRARPSVARP